MRDDIRWFVDDLWDGIRARRGRTALALFAIAIGMISLTILVAVLGGLQRRSRQIVAELGVQVVAVTQDGTPEPGQEALGRGAVSLLARSLPACRVSAVRYSRVPTLGIDQTVPVVATDPSLAAVRQWPMREGRWLDKTDLDERLRNAVIGGELADELGWALGQIALVRDTPFVIVGICEAGGNPSGGPPGSRAVFVPLSVPPYWETQGENRSDRVDAIYLQAPADGDVYAVREAARRILQAPEVAAGRLAWITPDLLLAGLRNLQRTVRVTAGSVVLLCLLLGGTTLMSLMVAAVRERIHEIGLRRSLGATPRDIAGLFAAEACLVTLTAALAGAGAAHLLLWLVADRLPVPVALGPASVFVPLAGAMVLGMLFAYAPARSAAAIAPAEALRNP